MQTQAALKQSMALWGVVAVPPSLPRLGDAEMEVAVRLWVGSACRRGASISAAVRRCRDGGGAGAHRCSGQALIQAAVLGGREPSVDRGPLARRTSPVSG